MLYSRLYPLRNSRAIAPTATPMPTPQPLTGVPGHLDAAVRILGPGLDMLSAAARLAELKKIYDAEGKRDWAAIQAIAKPLGVRKHPDGWDSSLLRIIEAEYSAEIAAALEAS